MSNIYHSSLEELPISKGDQRFQMGDDFFIWHDAAVWYLSMDSDPDYCQQLTNLVSETEILHEALVIVNKAEDSDERNEIDFNKPLTLDNGLTQVPAPPRSDRFYKCGHPMPADITLPGFICPECAVKTVKTSNAMNETPRPMQGMTVAELIEQLQGLPKDKVIAFSYGYGDHWHTQVVKNIKDVQVVEVEYSNYHSMFKVADIEEDEVDVETSSMSVVVLS